MKYGSVCSGIEAATVAWHGLGWTPAFFSEIEPFPKAVLSHRWPAVPDLGDFTMIGADRGPVDLLVGGTPCQSFSVAGLRKGMADARGNLALEFLRLAARLDARWILWENVPGVLSSSGGRDFGAFLGGLAELGYGFAYRVLDAQFFGVAQRRRRVFVVGHAGGLWQRAAAVLFERASVRGDPAPRREARADVAGTLGAGPSRGGWDPGQFDRNGALIPQIGIPDPAYAVTGGPSGQQFGTGRDAQDTFVVGLPIPFDTTQITHPENRSKCEPGSPSPSLAQAGHPPAVAFHITQDPISSSDATPALGCGNRQGCGTLGVATPCDSDDQQMRVLRRWNEWDESAAPTMAVRRLTPTECERLQGFPDGYTAIPGAKDGPRYRALGNSMAVPVMRWIGQRIAMVETATAAQEAA
jgi:DNA (cytosine-5)-methyltransferase 1